MMQEKPNDLRLKYGNQENITDKIKWKNKMTRELEGLEEGPKAEIHIILLKTILIISNWKTPGHDGGDGFWFEKFTSIHDRLTLEWNRCLQGTHIPNG